MADVVPIEDSQKFNQDKPLRDARREYGLSLLEAAKALGVSPTQLEREEGRPSPGMDLCQVRSRFELFVATQGPAAGKNLIFGVLPLRVARDIMGLSVDTMAMRYDASPSHWRKLECHARELSVDTLHRIEADVRTSFAEICEAAAPAVSIGNRARPFLLAVSDPSRK